MQREHAKLKRKEQLRSAHSAIAERFRAERHLEQTWVERRKLALELYFTTLAEVSDRKEDALDFAARQCDVCKDSVRRWRDAYLDTGENFWTESYQEWGKHPKVRWHLHDADTRTEARAWVRAHVAPKTGAHMTAAMFKDYLNDDLLPRICPAEDSYTRQELLHAAKEHNLELKKYRTKAQLLQKLQHEGWVAEDRPPPTVSVDTATHYLHRLGFSHRRVGKSPFADGHERDDVVESRKQFIEDYFHYYENGPNWYCDGGNWVDKDTVDDLSTFQDAKYLGLGGSIKPDVLKKAQTEGAPIYIIFSHDESTFRTNDHHTSMWCDGSSMKFKSKNEGLFLFLFLCGLSPPLLQAQH